jgi:hypothetical protein
MKALITAPVPVCQVLTEPSLEELANTACAEKPIES